MGYLSELRLALYPDPERGSRFHVGAAVAGGDTPELVDRWKVAADAKPTARRRGEFARVASVFAERVGRKAIWYEKLEGWNEEESPVVNEWIAEAEGGTL
jgi:hypothetical protein